MKKQKTEHTAKTGGTKVMTFFKKNIYYILMIVCILAIGSMITVAAVVNARKNSGDTPPVINNPDDEDPGKNDPDDEDPGKDDPAPDDKPSGFIIINPIKDAQVDIGFSDAQLVYNPTQNHWATHVGVDFTAEAGSEVMAIFDGKIKSVNTDSYYGTSVVIEHADGYVSTYRLMDNVTVKAGDSVKQGDVIGKVSSSALAECKQAAHLHLELTKDGKAVDPMAYMPEGDK